MKKLLIALAGASVAAFRPMALAGGGRHGIMAATTGDGVITAITSRTITTDITTTATAAIITIAAASASGFMAGHFTGALPLLEGTITRPITTAVAIELERTDARFRREKNTPASRECILRDSRWRFVLLADVGSSWPVPVAS